MTRAVIYVEGLVPPEECDVGRQKKLRVCRAYCRRMGYDVVKVIAASKPKPSVTDEALRIYYESGAVALRTFLAAQPHHREDDADALVESGDADVKVVFTSIGDSRPFDWNYTPEMQKLLPEPQRLEQASLWELEPPTPEARQRYQWLMEDLARLHQHIPTRAGLYVRASKTPAGRGYDVKQTEQAERQEQYCQGYCQQRGYAVSQMYREVSPSDDDDPCAALNQAIRAFEQGDIHVLVALDENIIAEDAEQRADVLARMPRIEYARSYAEEVRLTEWLHMMERLTAIFRRWDTPHESN